MCFAKRAPQGVLALRQYPGALYLGAERFEPIIVKAGEAERGAGHVMSVQTHRAANRGRVKASGLTGAI